MLQTLRTAALGQAGLSLTVEKCTWSAIGGKEQKAQEAADPILCLRGVPWLEPGRRLRVLGALVQVDGRRVKECLTIFRTAWFTFHNKRTLWAVPGHVHAKGARVARRRVPGICVVIRSIGVHKSCTTY